MTCITLGYAGLDGNIDMDNDNKYLHLRRNCNYKCTTTYPLKPELYSKIPAEKQDIIDCFSRKHYVYNQIINGKHSLDCEIFANIYNEFTDLVIHLENGYYFYIRSYDNKANVIHRTVSVSTIIDFELVIDDISYMMKEPFYIDRRLYVGLTGIIIWFGEVRYVNFRDVECRPIRHSCIKPISRVYMEPENKIILPEVKLNESQQQELSMLKRSGNLYIRILIDGPVVGYQIYGQLQNEYTDLYIYDYCADLGFYLRIYDDKVDLLGSSMSDVSVMSSIGDIKASIFSRDVK